MLVHITKKSGNIKTGPIPVTTSGNQSCPSACPFKKSGCYADGGPLAIHWSKVSSGNRGEKWPQFIKTLKSTLAEFGPGQLWRHNQAGDLPGINSKINRTQALQLAKANKESGARGWTYTHKPMTRENQKTVREMVKLGFAVNLSANSLEHADKLSKLGIAPVACVLPADTTGARITTPEGRSVVVCPAQRINSVTCAKCGLCANLHPARPIVGFLAHGHKARAVSSIARGTN